MTRLITSAIAIALLTSATAAVGDSPAQPPDPALMAGLHALESSASSQAAAQSNDSSQAASHASEVAILTVCNHDNPSAQRAAICGQPNSPP